MSFVIKEEVQSCVSFARDSPQHSSLALLVGTKVRYIYSYEDLYELSSYVHRFVGGGQAAFGPFLNSGAKESCHSSHERVRNPYFDVLLLPLCCSRALDAALPLVEEVSHHPAGNLQLGCLLKNQPPHPLSWCSL